ncbi:MAG: hypothetical protein COW19_07550 [Zetaproteobacteria bacterium CG12_big_fil_rev_8_21_14_0_65_55_1124]|nr:MAG: hypothetical protein COT53_03265 [Zetaproteobacteria bacterium CG08_land_8_20_14_0_20_55_17]PIW42524.1 MAG: hypothetical protein COW19_07550 [Zetaproteobacteria bacterium CG12_big_fil_rev_8_21_14_0_65_55_1124]
MQQGCQRVGEQDSHAQLLRRGNQMGGRRGADAHAIAVAGDAQHRMLAMHAEGALGIIAGKSRKRHHHGTEIKSGGPRLNHLQQCVVTNDAFAILRIFAAQKAFLRSGQRQCAYLDSG